MDEQGETQEQVVNTEQSVDKSMELVEKENNNQLEVIDLHLPVEFERIKPNFLKIELLEGNINIEPNFPQNTDAKATDRNLNHDTSQIQENSQTDSKILQGTLESITMQTSKDRMALIPTEFFKSGQTESAQMLQSYRLKLFSNNDFSNCAQFPLEENSVLVKQETKRIREAEETCSDENSSKRVKVEQESDSETLQDSINIQKCVKNDDFLKHLLKDKIPSTWEMNSEVPFSLKTVLEDTNEYNEIKKLFASTSRGRTIEKLERVENPYLLGHFLMKKEKMKNANISVKEKYLYHGTREDFIESICENNLDWRRRGSSRGHKFGQGVSFAPEVSYARHYTPDQVMFLVKVLVGECITGDCSTVVPPSSYDTTANSPRTVFVKYEDDDFYPAYVIHYDVQSVSWNMNIF